MFIDSQLQFAQNQAVTASAASTNIVDLGTNREPGVSDGLRVFNTVSQSATAAGAATVQLQLQAATDAAFTAPIILNETDMLPVAQLTAGFTAYVPVPITLGVNYRYLRMFYNVGTGPLTAGAFTSEIVTGPQANRAYPAPYQA